MKPTKKRGLLYILSAVSVLFGIVLMTVWSAVRFTGLLFVLLGGVILLWAVLDKWSEKKKAGLIAKRILSVLLVLGSLLFVFLEAEVIRRAKTDSETAVAGVIILGAGINGMEPSLSLRVRLEAALEYIADKPDIPIVVTGSQGPREVISEAECMANWLVAHGVPEERILMEAAIFADKASITEELVRLDSHMDQLRMFLTEGGGAIGKKLDFLVQEMNRETNTIGSKANDLEITSLMLEAKSEIEKIREQVQNIE